MTTALDQAPALVRESWRGTWRITRSAVATPVWAAREVTGLPAAVRAALSAGDDAGVDRQVWAIGDRAVLEVRGLDRPGVDRGTAAAAIRDAIAADDGITQARVDATTSVLAVRYDSARLSIADVARARALRRGAGAHHLSTPPTPADGGPGSHRLATEDMAGDEVPSPMRPPRPSPSGPGLAADPVALATVAVARLARVPAVPTGAAGLVALAEHQPWLRRRLTEQLGQHRADRCSRSEPIHPGPAATSQQSPGRRGSGHLAPLLHQVDDGHSQRPLDLPGEVPAQPPGHPEGQGAHDDLVRAETAVGQPCGLEWVGVADLSVHGRAQRAEPVERRVEALPCEGVRALLRRGSSVRPRAGPELLVADRRGGDHDVELSPLGREALLYRLDEPRSPQGLVPDDQVTVHPLHALVRPGDRRLDCRRIRTGPSGPEVSGGWRLPQRWTARR